MYGRTALVTGGTGGVGLDVARALLARGATVVIGSRDPARYARAAGELGGKDVHPFIVDITDSVKVDRELERMYASGIVPTDVIHSAAGGMEPVLRDVARLSAGLRKLRGAELDRAHAAARSELAPLVADSRGAAMTVNFAAPSRLLEQVVARMPDGGNVFFYSSLWASLYPHPQVPIFYEAVAEAKLALERWLENQAPAWALRRITTAVISANAILNTRMGYLLDRFCAEPLPPAERDRWRSDCVTCSELVNSTIAVFERSHSPGGFVRLFLTRPGEVVDRMGADDAPMLERLAFARNAPIWREESERAGSQRSDSID
jgi:NAD(P)-dependent dehydrogenase (short-subunit alcohol dehydrogenase family)